MKLRGSDGLIHLRFDTGRETTWAMCEVSPEDGMTARFLASGLTLIDHHHTPTCLSCLANAAAHQQRDP